MSCTIFPARLGQSRRVDAFPSGMATDDAQREKRVSDKEHSLKTGAEVRLGWSRVLLVKKNRFATHAHQIIYKKLKQQAPIN